MQNIETLLISHLKPSDRNPRQHSDAQVEQIAASIQEFGWTVPILIDGDLNVIAGHGRLLAAQSLGLESVPTICLDHLSPAQVRAYRIADNRLNEGSTWDTDILKDELAALQAQEFDFGPLGFEETEVQRILGPTEGQTDPDDAQEPPVEPISKLGDLWLLGKHRLLCGDCTQPEAVKRLLDGATPNLMVTDPPYGVEYDPDWRSSLDSIDRATGEFQGDEQADWNAAYALFPGNVVYVWHGSVYRLDVQAGLSEHGFELRTEIVWVKPMHVISRGHYHGQHEPCLYAVRKGATSDWIGDRSQSTVWEIANRTFQGKGQQDETDTPTGHGTQKPIACMERPIINHAGDVYDPFLGSGTTLIAAERQGRTCYGLEIAPGYVDVAVKRWEAYTGKTAERLT